MLNLFIFWLTLNSTSAAPPCSTKYWSIRGTLAPQVKAYDDLLVRLQYAKDPVHEINTQIAREGLLLQLAVPEDNVPGLTDYLIGEGASGYSVGLFFNRMRIWDGFNAFFATIHEVPHPGAKRPLRQWLVPMGASPVAVEGFRIIYREKLVGVCNELSYVANLRVSDEGNYEAIARDSFPAPEPVPEAKCTAQRALFKDSAHSNCMQFTDLTTKAKRILVWDHPVK